MDNRDSANDITRTEPVQPAEPPVPAAEPPAPAAAPPGSAAALVSIICGIVACALDLLVVTVPLGVLFAIVGFGCGFAARRRGHRGLAGLVLASVSLFIVIIYAASVLVPMLADPTSRL
ncbi:DUF308 domain-containing protein [Gordoniibacillus kamchatkensis]|uniref:DUF308 domain-containing protein n=1 Tax=Gordoniibacillus kamchatkensis TaxID=1590651 RepID=UPI0012E026F8|nr:DUF308 domain-containing protein [Paenibacillus sp. VKM B-2647]